MSKISRSMMIVPGNNPGIMRDAHIYGAHSLIFDLTQSVPENEKDAARFLVYNALKTIDFEGAEIIIKVNTLKSSHGREDLEAALRTKPDVIGLSKVETKEDVLEYDKIISEIENSINVEVGSTKIIIFMETPLSILNSFEIGKASKRIAGLAVYGETLLKELGTTQTIEGVELFHTRSQIVLVANALNIQSIDTIYVSDNNEENFLNEVKASKHLGFTGKLIRNPNQIPIVHKVYGI